MKTILREISNILIRKLPTITALSLLHGKTGICIYLFHYSRLVKDQWIENYAMTLVEDICTQLPECALPDYEHGLTGICTGIEYLIQNGFIDADPDTFHKVDQLVFKLILTEKYHNISLYTGLLGYGRYILHRLSGTTKDFATSLNFKTFLILIVDLIERKIGSFNSIELENIKLFLKNINNLDIYPTKVSKISEILNIPLKYDSEEANPFSYYNYTSGEINYGLLQGLSGIGMHILTTIDKDNLKWTNLI